ncbi:MAG: AAA family ATPase [Nitrospirae bacterium]|nr:AAA family ATPase [Nitrospirota bacterium]
MLKRILKIQNVGRFIDCSAGGCNFGATTLIYANNTNGKSTLTAILRSLQNGNSDLIIGRKSFGMKSSKKIELLFDNGAQNIPFVFQDKKWNQLFPNILIFDSHFISRNIFEGENISFENQKNLNQIIIGQDGQKLSREIAALERQSTDLASKKREKSAEFSRHFPSASLDAFLKLHKDDEIENKLAKLEQEITIAREKEKLKALLDKYINELEKINFYDIRSILEKNLDILQHDIEQHLKDNFASRDNATQFLKAGLSYLKEKPLDSKRRCVFCGQHIEGSGEHLIKVYGDFFKSGYEDLQKAISLKSELFKQWNLEALLARITAEVQALQVDMTLSLDLQKIANTKKTVDEEIAKKIDLTYRVDFNSFDLLQAEVERIIAYIKHFKATNIDATTNLTMPQLEQKKKHFVLIRDRFKSEWINFSEQHKAISEEADKIRKERDSKREKLDEYARKIFGQHKDTINSFCRQLGADFEIVDLTPLKKLKGQDERLFVLKFYGIHRIEIGAIDEKRPNFKNSLSESDKRLLAFAFFLSILAHDDNLDKNIIVFDDPISSFDRERKRKTVHLIADISSRGKLPLQKIILTHERSFLNDLLCDPNLEEAVTLEITSEIRDGIKQSKIEHCDRSLFLDDEILKKIKRLRDILDKELFIEQYEKDCRTVLEYLFKTKYYFELRDDIVNRKGVRSFAEKIFMSDKPKRDKFLRVCNDLNIPMHDGTLPLPSHGDVKSILRDFFECLREV